MVDESKPAASDGKVTVIPASSVPPRYDWLRWAIRITGIVLMLAGTVYLGMTAARLLTDNQSENELFLIVCSIIVLGIGIYVLRIGFAMLRSIDAHTIGSFSFVFSLVYTFVVAQILPASGFMSGHLILLYGLIFLFFILSYWILRAILFCLLLPREER